MFVGKPNLKSLSLVRIWWRHTGISPPGGVMAEDILRSLTQCKSCIFNIKFYLYNIEYILKSDIIYLSKYLLKIADLLKRRVNCHPFTQFSWRIGGPHRKLSWFTLDSGQGNIKHYIFYICSLAWAALSAVPNPVVP